MVGITFIEAHWEQVLSSKLIDQHDPYFFKNIFLHITVSHEAEASSQT